MNVCPIVLAVVSASHEPICYSDEWGVVIIAGTETCQATVRTIADTLDPGWRERPFSHWHGLLSDAEDGEMSIATNAAYTYDQPSMQNKREARMRAWITCLVVMRDQIANRKFNRYRRGYR